MKLASAETRTFILNGKQVSWEKPTITFAEIESLSEPWPTVVWRTPARLGVSATQGSLTKFEELVIVPGLNVSAVNTGNA